MARNQQLSPYRSGDTARGSDPFFSLQREMNRLFDDVFRGFGMPSSPVQGQEGRILQPEVDVSETDKEIKICADLPGVAEQDVDVTLDEDVLTIRAERRQERTEEKESYHIVERTHGTFQRALRLPAGIDPEGVEARFENGVLVVTIPKSEEAQRSRRIRIQGKATSGEQLEQAAQPAAGQQRSPEQPQGEGGQHPSQARPSPDGPSQHAH